MRTVIVYGPRACGKTRGRQSLAASFGCRTIIDDWHPDLHMLVPGALHLTNVPMLQHGQPIPWRNVEIWDFAQLRVREDKLDTGFAVVKMAQQRERRP